MLTIETLIDRDVSQSILNSFQKLFGNSVDVSPAVCLDTFKPMQGWHEMRKVLLPRSRKLYDVKYRELNNKQKAIYNSMSRHHEKEREEITQKYDANLSYTNLSNANLSYAYLSYANLSGATLTGANLFGAYLYNTNVY